MKKLVRPSVVNGTIQAPASKSAAQRLIALASLAKGQSEVYYAGNSDDVKAAISVCRELGATIEESPNKLSINGGISDPDKQLNCGESGLGIRMFSCIAASLNKPITLTGNGTLVSRPMNIVEESLRAMGATCKAHNNLLPIIVQGPLKGGTAKVDGSLSSQVLTGMLMAAPLAQANSKILVSNLQSKPYIDLTIEAMQNFGVEVENNNYEEFKIEGQQTYKPAKVTVEGDWSGAAFLIVAGAIAGSVRIDNIKPMSKQADRAIIEALMQAGAKVTIQDSFIEVSKNELNAFHFNATNCPDLFPPLAALAANCNGESRILGVGRLRSKESDRALTIQQEFAKMGIMVKIDGDLMRIFGGKVKCTEVESHGDHRIAMTCAIAALNGDGEMQINEAEAVGKSYPNFFEDLQTIIY